MNLRSYASAVLTNLRAAVTTLITGSRHYDYLPKVRNLCNLVSDKQEHIQL